MQRRACVLSWWVVLGATVSGCSSNQFVSTPKHTDSLHAELQAAPEPRISRAQKKQQIQQIQFRPQAPSSGQLPSLPEFERPLPGRQIQILAWVNGSPIFNQDVYPFLGQAMLLEEPKRTEYFNKLLHKIIDDEVVYQEARTKLKKASPAALKDLKKSAEKIYQSQLRRIQKSSKLTMAQLKENLQQSGIELGRFRYKIERDFFVKQYLRSRVMPLVEARVGYREIRAYYDGHPEEFKTPDWVRWQDVFISAVNKERPTLAAARSYAQQLKNAMRTSDDFVKLIKYDEGASVNGEGYGHVRGEIKPSELEPYLFNMRAGEVGPIVEISTGVHLFRVVERKYAGRVAFTPDVQKQIRSKLRNQMAQRESNRIIRELRERSVIEIVAK